MEMNMKVRREKGKGEQEVRVKTRQKTLEQKNKIIEKKDRWLVVQQKR